jgi:hypothetical protein
LQLIERSIVRNYPYASSWLLNAKAVLYCPLKPLLFSATEAEIATRNGLEGSGLESRWGQVAVFSAHSSRPALGPTHPPLQWLPGLFPRDKGAGAWRWLCTRCCVYVKNEWKPYLCLPWHVMGRPLPLPSPLICITTETILILKAVHY